VKRRTAGGEEQNRHKTKKASGSEKVNPDKQKVCRGVLAGLTGEQVERWERPFSQSKKKDSASQKKSKQLRSPAKKNTPLTLGGDPEGDQYTRKSDKDDAKSTVNENSIKRNRGDIR